MKSNHGSGLGEERWIDVNLDELRGLDREGIEDGWIIVRISDRG